MLSNGFPSLLLYEEYSNTPSLSVTTNFDVVEPASIPIKQSPLCSDKGFFSTLSFSCLALNSSYSTFVLNNGCNGCVVVSCDCLNTCILLFNFSTLIGIISFASRHAPFATNKCASSGTIVCSGVKFKVSTNLFLNSGIYVSGPPKNATFPRIGLPHANPLIV